MQGNKKVIRGWLFYDWANSVYSLTITTAVFPIYFLSITSAEDGSSQLVNFLGFEIDNVALYTFALSTSFLIAAFLTPLLSGMADYAGKKLLFMKIFCYTGALACASMFFFEKGSPVEWGIIPFIIAGIGYTGSIVFYNAYLPEICPIEDQDKVSAKGYAFGYIGSVILLVLNLALILSEDKLGLAPGEAARWSFLSVAIWWAGFAQITFNRLPENVYHKKTEGNLLAKGFLELAAVFRELRNYGNLKYFLFSFFFYSMGLQTVMYLASTFAEKEIRMESSLLIVVILLIQIVAIAGAHLFSWLSKKFGNLKALGIAVCAWIVIIAVVYFVYNPLPFIGVAFAVGLIMGGSQALSRSTYSKLLPDTKDHASYFSFYDVSEKLSIVLGTFFYGLIYNLSGSLRYTIIVLELFFVIGLILLVFVRRKGTQGQLERVRGE